jgi:single-stranded-DNA-specific exonuclease
MGEVDLLVRQLHVSRILAHLLVKRGLTDPEDAEAFLKPALKGLGNPLKLTNLEKAANRILKAVWENESIIILGDYDVDGVTSTTLLVSFLKIFGSLPRYVVPRRLEEGYGMSKPLIDRAISEEHPSLFIALDCGTNSIEEVTYLREKGIDVIIVDHHQSTQEESADCILVNPHVFDPYDSPWRDLCSVGLTFKLVHGIVKILREQGNEEAHQIQLKDYLDLVALGTIADLVPLREENRILVRHGLRRLRQSTRCGIQALFQVSGLGMEGKDLRASDISFRLGPRINASGRLADAALPIEMLLSENFQDSIQAARQLDEMNSERQRIERDIVTEAEEMVSLHYKDSNGVVVFNQSWHPGVVGIVASRLTNILKKPTIVLGAEGHIAKGSGRSVPGLDLVKALGFAETLLIDYGGHPMAVGLSLNQKDLAKFRETFDRAVKELGGDETFEPVLDIDCWIQPEDIAASLLDQLEQLHPFGQGNPEPVLGTRFMELVVDPQPFGEGGKNFRFYHFNPQGERISAIAWNLGSRLPPARVPIDLAFKFAWNHYNGTSSPQMEILDWRLSQ